MLPNGIARRASLTGVNSEGWALAPGCSAFHSFSSERTLDVTSARASLDRGCRHGRATDRPTCATFALEEARSAYDRFAQGGKLGKVVLLATGA